MTQSDYVAIGKLARLEVLDLSESDVEDVKFLETLPHLKELNLNTTDVSDFGPISSLTRLTVLGVARTPFEDVKILERLPALEDLDLRHTDVVNIRPLLDRESPPILHYSGTWISIDQIQLYEEKLNVREIEHRLMEDIQGVYESGEELATITAVGLPEPREPRDNLSVLMHFGHITVLRIGGTKCTDDGCWEGTEVMERQLKILKRLPNLQVLDLAGTFWRDLQLISHMKHLHSVSIPSTCNDLSPLYAAKTVKKLYVSAKDLQSGRFAEIKRRRPDLRILCDAKNDKACAAASKEPTPNGAPAP